MKHPNLCMIGILEEKRRDEHGSEEIMAENLPGLKKEIEAQKYHKINPKRLIPRHT